MASPIPKTEENPTEHTSGKVPPMVDLWQYFLSRLAPLHRDEMAAERSHLNGYQSDSINAEAKLILCCFMLLFQAIGRLRRDLAVIVKLFRASLSRKTQHAAEPNPQDAATLKMLGALAPQLHEINRILRIYGDMEAIRLLNREEAVISNPERAARDANTEALANKITRIWNRKAKEQECWYDKPFASIPRKAWIFGLFCAATILVFIQLACSLSQKAADRITKEVGSLRQHVEKSDMATANTLAAVNENISLLMQQTISDVITYQEIGGKSYAMLPDGSWKLVTFHNVTPANTTK